MIGDVEVELFPGVVIVAPCVGGACVFVASSPYEPGFGSGVGSGVRALAWCAPHKSTNSARRHDPMKIGRVHCALSLLVCTMLVLIVARVRSVQKFLVLFFAARFLAVAKLASD